MQHTEYHHCKSILRSPSLSPPKAEAKIFWHVTKAKLSVTWQNCKVWEHHFRVLCSSSPIICKHTQLPWNGLLALAAIRLQHRTEESVGIWARPYLTLQTTLLAFVQKNYKATVLLVASVIQAGSPWFIVSELWKLHTIITLYGHKAFISIFSFQNALQNSLAFNFSSPSPLF